MRSTQRVVLLSVCDNACRWERGWCAVPNLLPSPALPAQGKPSDSNLKPDFVSRGSPCAEAPSPDSELQMRSPHSQSPDCLAKGQRATLQELLPPGCGFRGST